MTDPHPPLLDQLVQVVQDAQTQVRAACVMLWHQARDLEPGLLDAQRRLGWSDMEAAQWLESALQTHDASRGWPLHTRVWLGQLQRAAAGFHG